MLKNYNYKNLIYKHGLINHVPYSRDYSSHIFNSYLTGLYEGDGHITINKKQAQFCITFNLKDLPLAEKLLSILQHGFIRIKQKENACVLMISNKEGLLIIINKLNGNFRSPKIYKFYKLIDFMNHKHSLIIDNKHNLEDNIIIHNLKNTMKNKRSYFNWDHLDSLKA
jgi:hypothetical protein